MIRWDRNGRSCPAPPSPQKSDSCGENMERRYTESAQFLNGLRRPSVGRAATSPSLSPSQIPTRSQDGLW